MTLTSVLWQNWQHWAAGGLPAETVDRELGVEDRNFLVDWLQTGFQAKVLPLPSLTPKEVVDTGRKGLRRFRSWGGGQ